MKIVCCALSCPSPAPHVHPFVLCYVDFPYVSFIRMGCEDGMHVIFTGGVASHELANLGAVQVKKKVVSYSCTGAHTSPYVCRACCTV